MGKLLWIILLRAILRTRTPSDNDEMASASVANHRQCISNLELIGSIGANNYKREQTNLDGDNSMAAALVQVIETEIKSK